MLAITSHTTHNCPARRGHVQCWSTPSSLVIFKKSVSGLTALCFPLFSLCSGSGLPANIQLDIDGDRETERIYSLFNLYMSKLEKMQGKARVWSSLCLTVRRQLWGCPARVLVTQAAFCREDSGKHRQTSSICASLCGKSQRLHFRQHPGRPPASKPVTSL